MSNLHFKFWPKNLPHDITVPDTSLWFNIEVSASRYPQRPCIVFYDKILTYAEFKQQAEHLAGFLQKKCGVKRGDRVALDMQNSPQFVIAYYAILRADAMVVPVNPMNLTSELEHMVDDSGAKIFICGQEVYSQVLPLLDKNKVEHAVVACYSDYLSHGTDLQVPETVAAPRKEFPGDDVTLWTDALAKSLKPGPHLATADDLCVMPYTSGTTGYPKGCVHKHRSVMFNVISVPHWYHMIADESIFAVLPFFHVTGMQNSMNTPLYCGATIVILPRWDRDVAAQLVERYRVNRWTVVPTMVVDFVASPNIDKYDLSSLYGIGGGGAAMPEAVAQELERRRGIVFVEGYGLSETMAPTHINPENNPKKQCLGIPIFNTDSRVVDPETLKELPPGEVGEIISHGPQIFEGYWNKPEANAQCFVEIDGKKFFRTGDLARTDSDGYFFLVDRLKRMINASGYKVWPAEVEAMFYAHPAVKEAAIISKKDARRGETVKVVIALKDGHKGKVTEDEIIEWARQNMAAYKVPRYVAFIDALPRSGTGKIQWRALQEQEDQAQA
jgi:fatty-acyl-CoA synthase